MKITKEVRQRYDYSSPRLKRVWKSLCKTYANGGQKDMYFMILKFQELTKMESLDKCIDRKLKESLGKNYNPSPMKETKEVKAILKEIDKRISLHQDYIAFNTGSKKKIEELNSLHSWITQPKP